MSARPSPAVAPAEIEAVITCVGYGDFLAATLPLNRSQFHRVVVATTPDDARTRRVCEYWNVQCVTEPRFREGAFRKGAGINAGLRALRRSGRGRGWVVHMDADIFLPPLACEHILRAGLDPSYIYGIDRMMVTDYAAWAEFLAFPDLQHENRVFVHPRPFPMGVRVVTPAPGYDGYVPIGFFQLWSPAASGIWDYPEEHTDAGRGDMLFARNWPRARRGFIPEVIGYHLESAPAPMGANWKGRTTPYFAPGAPRPLPGLPDAAPADRVMSPAASY